MQPLTSGIAKQLELPAETKGLVVTEVDPEGPAAEVGITKGDVVLEINKQTVENFEEVEKALEKAGDKPSLLLIMRQGRVVFVTIEPKR